MRAERKRTVSREGARERSDPSAQADEPGGDVTANEPTADDQHKLGSSRAIERGPHDGIITAPATANPQRDSGRVCPRSHGSHPASGYADRRTAPGPPRRCEAEGSDQPRLHAPGSGDLQEPAEVVRSLPQTPNSGRASVHALTASKLRHHCGIPIRPGLSRHSTAWLADPRGVLFPCRSRSSTSGDRAARAPASTRR